MGPTHAVRRGTLRGRVPREGCGGQEHSCHSTEQQRATQPKIARRPAIQDAIIGCGWTRGANTVRPQRQHDITGRRRVALHTVVR